MAMNEFSLKSWYELYEIDFSNIPGVANNPDFQIRIRFDGDHMTADDGDRVTFNNISLDGVVLDAFNIFASAGSNGLIYPSGTIPVHEMDNMVFQIIAKENHQIADVIVDGSSVLDDLTFEGDTAVYSFRDVRTDHVIQASFRLDDSYFDDGEQLFLYPNPASGMVRAAAYDVINKIELLDMSGRLMRSYESVGSRFFDLYLEDFRNGLYLVIVHTNHGRYTRHLFVNR